MQKDQSNFSKNNQTDYYDILEDKYKSNYKNQKHKLSGKSVFKIVNIIKNKNKNYVRSKK